MPVSHLSGRKASVDVTIDGLTFRRTQSDAARRGTTPISSVEWGDVVGAEVQTTRKGRAIVRVAVEGAPPVDVHRDDPYALKVPRKLADHAQELADRINEEVGVRRRWRDGAPTT